MHVSSFAYKLAYIVVIQVQQNINNVCTTFEMLSAIAMIDFTFLGFLPSVPSCSLLMDDSYRKAALSTTGHLGNRGVVAILDLGECSMEGPKVPSEARRREAPQRRGGGVWGGAP